MLTVCTALLRHFFPMQENYDRMYGSSSIACEDGNQTWPGYYYPGKWDLTSFIPPPLTHSHPPAGAPPGRKPDRRLELCSPWQG